MHLIYKLYCELGNIRIYVFIYLQSRDYPENENVKNLIQEQLNSLSK